MEHEGKALAADETDTHHHRTAGIASIHVRAAVTWLAIFPLAAIGMTVLAALAPEWPPVLRAFALTLVVVPTAVYIAVPRLLQIQARLSRAATRARAGRTTERNMRDREQRRDA